jgi:Helix-turn-helix domain
MTKKETIFRNCIRGVFLFAYGAFLWASIHHVATFFHNFEPEGNDWTSSYTLAISIDVTALVLTIGVMFFRKSMPGLAFGLVWFFIIALTAFSWLVNWEYAQRFQSTNLTTNPTLEIINPILASSFAFLNLAYSLVAEFFSTKKQTAEELAQEADRLEALEGQQSRLDAVKDRMKKSGMIQRAKELAIEAKTAAKEVIGEREQVTPAASSLPDAPLHEKLELTLQFLSEHLELADNWQPGADAQLAAYLGLNREASARFWRLKAMELWPAYSASKSHQHAAPITTERDGADEGENASVSEDGRRAESASSRNQKTPAITGKRATSDDLNQGENASKTSARTSTSDGSSPALSVTVKEAATMLGLSESYVRELRNNKKLRSPGRNKKLILVSSISAYQKARQKTDENEAFESQENHHQNGHSDDHSEATIHLEEYAELRV